MRRKSKLDVGEAVRLRALRRAVRRAASKAHKAVGRGSVRLHEGEEEGKTRDDEQLQGQEKLNSTYTEGVGVSFGGGGGG